MNDEKHYAVVDKFRDQARERLGAAVHGAIMRAWAPPPKLSLSEWADKNRMLSSKSAAMPGRWKTRNEPMAKGVMDAVTNPLVEKVTIMAGAQILKALDCETPIPTPTDWVKMGDIQVGDQAFDENGLVCNVIGVSEVKVGHTCYRFTFSDGAEIICDAGHLWTVHDHGKHSGPARRTIEAREIAATWDSIRGRVGRNRYSVPMAKPISTPEADLPIDPYVLGVWLGDGHSYSQNITVHENDWQIVENCVNRGFVAETRNRTETGVLTVHLSCGRTQDFCTRGHDKRLVGRYAKHDQCMECSRQASLDSKWGTENRDPVREDLRSFGERLAILGLTKPRGEKSIPPAYLRASFEQRMELFRGLMDTDGTCAKNGRLSFTTTSDKLAAGFGELIGTLGLKNKPTLMHPVTQTGVNGALAWQFSFLAYDTELWFNLLRKQARVKSREGSRCSEVENRRITNVEVVESRPVRCIMVDSPSHLYLAGPNFVPTHNTEVLLNTVGYYIHNQPCPILFVQNTIDEAEKFSRQRLDPMLEETLVLRELFSNRSRDAANTMTNKDFPGGYLAFAGANAPRGLASRPIRVVLMDEIDGYPASAGKEGDPVGLAEARTISFWNRKIVLASTPTIKGESRIEASYEEGDARKFMPACPHCNVRQELLWKNVKWSDGRSETAHMVCDAEQYDRETGELGCGKPWTEIDRVEAIDAAYDLPDGGWVATKPFTGHASFHAGHLASRRIPLKDVVKKFLLAKGDPQRLKIFLNTVLALTFEEGGERADPTGLYARREDYSHDPLPEGVGMVTAGVDIQRNRFECEIVGWGAGDESWSIDYVVHYGDPSTDEFWEALDSVLLRQYSHPFGFNLRIDTACVDSGDNTQKVYDFCRPRFNRRVFAIKGRTNSIGHPVWPKKATRNQAKNIDMFLLGLDDAKWTTQRRLMQKEAGPGYCHFPTKQEYDENHFKGLTIEKSITKYKFGRPFRVWECPDGARNEPWDCRIYAYAARCSSPVDVAERLGAYKKLRAVQSNLPLQDQPKDKIVPQHAPTRRVRSRGQSA